MQFDTAPDLIVVSPHDRTQHTTAPPRERHFHVRCEVWPIHEFTYLAPTRCANTTRSQNFPWYANIGVGPPRVRGRAGAEFFARPPDLAERVKPTTTQLETSALLLTAIQEQTLSADPTRVHKGSYPLWHNW